MTFAKRSDYMRRALDRNAPEHWIALQGLLLAECHYGGGFGVIRKIVRRWWSRQWAWWLERFWEPLTWLARGKNPQVEMRRELEEADAMLRTLFSPKRDA